MEKKDDRILVAGNGKSGTTALFFRIKKSLRGNVSGFFEPLAFSEIEEHVIPDGHVIAKILLPADAGFLEKLNIFFGKKILLIRDPRDIIISMLLYTGAYEISWKKTPQQIVDCINLLKAKEDKPSSLSVVELLQHLLDYGDRRDLAQLLEHHVLFTMRLADDASFFIFKYEDLIADRLDSLESYLGFTLTSDTDIDKEYSRVVRAKKSASWKDWFIDEDINFFRPLFAGCIRRFDYDPDWTCNEIRNILPQHSSEYFKRLINERRSREGLSQI